MQVQDATFVVTDTETTGTSAGEDRVMEIGAVKMEGTTVVDTFQQLINPERSIPARITQMTGITTGMVFEKPTADEILPAYRDFLGDSILVAHNLSFDERFLNAELERTGAEPLGNETLCTLRLARRLLPGLKSKGLTRLIQFYDIDVDGRHRALGDAEATATILERFLSQLDFEHGVETVDDLLRFQHRTYKSIRETPKRIQTLRENTLPDLPEDPGVYFMKGSGGKTLYIGKAKSLKDRVTSYFNAIESHKGHRRKLMKKVRDVDWRTTPTELEAMLLESRLIKEQKPRFNRAQRRYRGRPFIRIDTTEQFPRVSWEYNLEGDGAEYYGPLRHRDQAELIVELISRFFQLRKCDDDKLRLGQRCLYADMDRCTAPCENEDAERYAAVVDRVRAFLTGQDKSVLDRLEERMQQASKQLEFEKAAQFRDWLEELERILEKQEAVAAPVLQHNAAVVHPQPDRPTVQVTLVRHGRPARTLALDPALPPEATARLQDAVRAVFDPDETPPASYSKRAIDEIRLLSHWMFKERDHVTQQRWQGAAPDAFTATIADTIQTHAEADAEKAAA